MLKPVTERGLRHYLEEVGKYSVLTKDEEYRLAKRIREKSEFEAKEKMILSNLKIVIYICKRFQGHWLSFNELINAGNQGLILAVEKFDERKGYRFSTYSVWWIKRAIYDAINTERGIVPKSHLARRIQSKTPSFIQEHGREPTPQELARDLNTDVSSISLALTELMPPLSLDETYDYDEIDAPYIETVRLDIEGADNLIAPAPDEIFKRKIEKEKLEKALDKLSDREREIIKRNFGLEDYDMQSLEEISRVMNITRERVRQIRENALRKLKAHLVKYK